MPCPIKESVLRFSISAIDETSLSGSGNIRENSCLYVIFGSHTASSCGVMILGGFSMWVSLGGFSLAGNVALDDTKIFNTEYMTLGLGSGSEVFLGGFSCTRVFLD